MAEGAVHGVENGVGKSCLLFWRENPIVAVDYSFSLRLEFQSHHNYDHLTENREQALKCGACKPFGAYILPLNGAKIIIYIYRGTDCPLFFEFFTPMYIDSRRVSHHSKKKM